MLSRIPLFAEVDPTALAALEQQTKSRHYKRHTVVIERGDEASTLYLLERGRAKVFVADDGGREMLLRELGPGDHFGELALLGELPRTASVMTLTDCETRLLTGSVFRAFLIQHPTMALALIRHLARQVAALTDTAGDLALLSVYQRVAKVLTEQAAADEAGRLMTGPLTQQQIADRVGCSREMVSRIVGDLKTGGYVSMEGKRFVLERRLPERW